jgi:uncharacterized protein
MIRGRCPICSKSFQIATVDDLPSFPFCSERCRLVDLGRWIDGRYAVPLAPASGSPEGAPEESDDDAD